MGAAEIPESIATGCAELDLAWATYAAAILKDGVMIPDTEEDLNWHAFLGHSIDMQGFRAAEFVGVDALTKAAPGFSGLKERDIGVRELGELWTRAPIREHLLEVTRRGASSDTEVTLGVLRRDGGTVGLSLAEAYAKFPYRKTNAGIRAYLQNSSQLAEHDYSFRVWFEAQCADLAIKTFPPGDFRPKTRTGLSVEWEVVRRLQQAFYLVGPAMAPYMICDWQLCLWAEGRTGVFEAFKLDSFHEAFVEKYGGGVIPAGQPEFIAWWLNLYSDIPPRLINECIWLSIEHRLVET
jgi:hypothetical protein